MGLIRKYDIRYRPNGKTENIILFLPVHLSLPELCLIDDLFSEIGVLKGKDNLQNIIELGNALIARDIYPRLLSIALQDHNGIKKDIKYYHHCVMADLIQPYFDCLIKLKEYRELLLIQNNN